jgi:outer membrane protein OmpA-like peptidoglycan-associated protein
MRWSFLTLLVIISYTPGCAQTIPNYREPWLVSHLHEPNKSLIRRPNAPKHSALGKVVCFKKACRSIIGWKRTQQRNKFKGYKKPGIPRLRYLKYDTLQGIETLPAPVVRDSVSTTASQPTSRDTTIAYVFDDVLFDTNSSQLKDEFINKLDSLSGIIKKYDDYQILIVGHTDTSGSEKANASLSRERAEAVASYFVSAGIDRGVIRAEGRGSRNPIADNRTAAGRQKNRRVEVFLSFK